MGRKDIENMREGVEGEQIFHLFCMHHMLLPEWEPPLHTAV
jgi:hypothetical protein